jgi:hypothetical protein
VVQIDAVGDDAITAALGVRSRALVGEVAFLSLQWLEQDGDKREIATHRERNMEREGKGE